MSVYYNSIQAFIQILYSHSKVISLPDWEELHQMFNTLPKDDDEEISERLENWLQPESRSQLLEIYKQNLKSISATSAIDLGVNIGIGNSKSQTPANQPSPSSKELLDNAIKENSPLSDKQKSQPTP
ncbi:hypothetical protein IQ244_12230 [Nostoc sp. LEGE 06077]|uniref:hypothetical protein n=1 Tax=Nostoc sp. LEGE 06077 TaxID=915325 RepID=UPI00187E99ED|nr:hypothetical protein [Nostoc sp. LEGE 06077]MBE9207278.1 hypothetical protein [Nostoc sp. LEGE 06077]